MFRKYTNEGTFFVCSANPSSHVPSILACGETNPICQTRGNKTRELLRNSARIRETRACFDTYKLFFTDNTILFQRHKVESLLNGVYSKWSANRRCFCSARSISILYRHESLARSNARSMLLSYF